MKFKNHRLHREKLMNQPTSCIVPLACLSSHTHFQQIYLIISLFWNPSRFHLEKYIRHLSSQKKKFKIHIFMYSLPSIIHISITITDSIDIRDQGEIHIKSMSLLSVALYDAILIGYDKWLGIA